MNKCEIHISKKEITYTPQKVNFNYVTDLRIYSSIKSDLKFLSEFPNIINLTLIGTFKEIESLLYLKQLSNLHIQSDIPVDFSGLGNLSLHSLTVGNYLNDSIVSLLSKSLQYLELYGVRKLTSLSFIERASGLKKLYLHGLPAVESLPDFGKLQNLYALKVCELHKLKQIDSLTVSAIQYFAFTLAADTLSGTKIAETLLSMKELKQVGVQYLDRSNMKRYNVIRNKFEKAEKISLLSMSMNNYNEWEAL